jgi:sec-independent protein translocase protein TatA
MVGLDNPLHIAMILLVVLLVFGAKRLPEMGKSMGEGLRGFKHSLSGEAPEHPMAQATEHAPDAHPAVERLPVVTPVPDPVSAVAEHESAAPVA